MVPSYISTPARKWMGSNIRFTRPDLRPSIEVAVFVPNRSHQGDASNSPPGT